MNFRNSSLILTISIHLPNDSLFWEGNFFFFPKEHGEKKKKKTFLFLFAFFLKIQLDGIDLLFFVIIYHSLMKQN